MNCNSTHSLAPAAPIAGRPRFTACKAFAFTLIALSATFASAQERDDPKVPAGLSDVLKDFEAGKPVASTVTLPLTIGYFGGQTALYITPEVGVDPAANSGAYVGLAKFLANAFHANYVTQNFATLTTPPNNSTIADPIFVFPAGTPTTFNGTFIQANILNSAPHPTGPQNTDANYSPLWQINLVYFQPGRERVLKSAQDVAAAKAAGDLLPGFPAAVPIIVECTVVYTPSGGLLPTAKVQEARGKDDNDRRDNDR